MQAFRSILCTAPIRPSLLNATATTSASTATITTLGGDTSSQHCCRLLSFFSANVNHAARAGTCSNNNNKNGRKDLSSEWAFPPFPVCTRRVPDLRHKRESFRQYSATNEHRAFSGRRGSSGLRLVEEAEPGNVSLSTQFNSKRFLKMGISASKQQRSTLTTQAAHQRQTAAATADMTGNAYLADSKICRGLSVPESERDALGLTGLLAPAVRTLDQQVEAVIKNLDRFEDELSRYLHLRHLQDFDERLFYAVLGRHTEKLMPIVYTPTVGQACVDYSLLYFRPRGLYISIKEAGRIHEILGRWPEKDIKAIVVTDGERILGLGDQGANGMGIPVGKLALYTALAGYPPHLTLPITIDVGTNNVEHRADPLYVGLKEERLRGPKYDQFIEEFMTAVTKRYGRSCLIQFEDFGNQNAFRLLEKYKDHYCTFNDDIQGTASVALAGIFASFRITKEKLSHNTFLFAGAGEAALGTADLLVMAMEEEGLTNEEAHQRIWLLDSKGLIVKNRPAGCIDHHKALYAKDHGPLTNLEEIVDLVKPTVLIGVSAQGGMFSPKILSKMNDFSQRPVIFALSNPTSKAECTAEQAYTSTQGRCIFASGSPFDPVTLKDGTTFIPGQGNNAYIFPGVGLAVMACGVRHIPDKVFLIAARALADQVSEGDLEEGRVYPPLSQIHQVSLKIAVKLSQYFFTEGLANHRPEPQDKEQFLKNVQYNPEQ